MVLLMKLFLTGAFFISIATTNPTRHPSINDLSSGFAESDSSTIFSEPQTTKRQVATGTQLLQWAPDGSLLYLIGTIGSTIGQLPPEIAQMIFQGSPSIPGQTLIDMFSTYLREGPVAYPGADNIRVWEAVYNHVNIGSIYKVGATDAAGHLLNGMWGFGMSWIAGHVPDPAELASLVAALTAFAQQDGGRILVQMKRDAFFPASDIGAGTHKRSRYDNCPARTDLRIYANADVPDNIDYATNLRWAALRIPA